MIKIPPYLRPGDTIGIVCPAGYMAEEKLEVCIRTLHDWGYQTRLGLTVGGQSATYFSGTDEERLKDLQLMLDDHSINAVLCGRGGYGVSRIIDRLQFRSFRKRPKWIIGFSDITLLHSHIYSNFYISSLHAPMAAAFNDGGAENEFIGSLRKALQGERMNYEVAAHQFNRTGECEAELVGGNLALLAHSMGTASEVKTKDRLLFIEDVGEYTYNIDRMMRQLLRAGKLDKLAGLIIGGFTDGKDTERPFGKPVYEVIRELLPEKKYPVCFQFPVSHGKENYALKIGVQHRLQVQEGVVRLSERSKPK